MGGRVGKRGIQPGYLAWLTLPASNLASNSERALRGASGRARNVPKKRAALGSEYLRRQEYLSGMKNI